ncbi:MAG: alpha/beta fold hydrolase, partial [Pollutimonas bauzanensis]
MTVPFAQGMLDVGAGHRLSYAEYGRPDAPAAVVLHGGPGSACQPSMLDWFDLSRQRVVLFDQRGAGKSAPAGCIAGNTTQDLVGDIERLRRFLRISDWLVVGGSWGAMLGLMYCGAHPAAVRGMVLRGVFLPGVQQMDWFFQELRALVPVAWAQLTAGMSPAERRKRIMAIGA